MPSDFPLLQSRGSTGPVLLAVALILLAVIGVFAYRDQAAFAAARAQSAEIRHVQEAAQNLLSNLKDAETGQRGYLLTGKPEYLEPYRAASERVPVILNALRALLRDEPSRKDRLDALSSFASDKIEELRQTIVLYDRQGFRAALSLVTTDRGQRDMDEVRRLCAELESSESQRLIQNSNVLESSAARNRYVTGFGSLALFSLVTAAAIMIRRDIDRQQQLTQELSDGQQRYQTLAEELEVRVQERTAELETANKELESFSYSVSHDLRAPLRSIDGFSRIVLDDYADKLDRQGREMLERVRAATQRMGILIDDLLKLARVGRAEFRLETVSLTDIVRSILAELQTGQPERKVETVIAENVVVSGDGALLRVALENLIFNSWKFTSKKPDARIEFGIEADNVPPVYFVKDNGAGFDMAYASRLFAPFQRLHNAREYEGTGVGLATVQRIIHRHGGRIWVEAAVERGAAFYFTL